MKITVRYFNILSVYTDCKSETLTFPAPLTLMQLIIALAERFPAGFAQIALQDGKLAPHLRVFINGNPLKINDEDVLIQDGDEVMLFPAVAGG